MTNARLKPALVTARAIRSTAVASFRSRHERAWNTIGAMTMTRPIASTSPPSAPRAARG